jgi:CBS domain-containing protein
MNQHVRDVMIPTPFTVDSGCPLPEAARLMRAWDVRDVLVVEDDILQGVLTDTDIIVMAIASGVPPSDLAAGDCVVREHPQLQVDQLVPEALAYLRCHQVNRVPVVDGDRLVGTVWAGDLEIASRPNCPRSAGSRSVA